MDNIHGRNKRQYTLSLLLTLVFLILSPRYALTQSTETETEINLNLSQLPKPAPTTLGSYLLPALAIPLVNIAYWTPSKLGGKDYAQINFNTMRGNLTHGWVIDEDGFETNQIGHPYQGNNYFNSARMFGLGFWESSAYTMGGSLMWEYFMESGAACCYPSVNDLVTTTLGGIILGELLWRFSNTVLDDSSTGGERFLREATALALSPPYGVYRLLNGDAYASGESNTIGRFVRGEFSLGGSVFGAGGDDTSDFTGIGRLRLQNAGPKTLSNRPEPFDYYNLRSRLRCRSWQ